MSSPNVVNIIRVPGRLIANPTDLVTAPAYGGTQLGIHRDIEIRFDAKYYPIRAEEFGNVPVDMLYCGQSAYLKGVARGLDEACMALLFPYTFTGAGHTVVADFPTTTGGGTRAGKLMSTTSVKLLFAPLDPTNHPFVVFYKAMPVVPEEGYMPFTRSEEIAYPFAFRGMPDSSGRVFAVGRAGSISL